MVSINQTKHKNQVDQIVVVHSLNHKPKKSITKILLPISKRNVFISVLIIASIGLLGLSYLGLYKLTHYEGFIGSHPTKSSYSNKSGLTTIAPSSKTPNASQPINTHQNVYKTNPKSTYNSTGEAPIISHSIYHSSQNSYTPTTNVSTSNNPPSPTTNIPNSNNPPSPTTSPGQTTSSSQTNCSSPFISSVFCQPISNPITLSNSSSMVANFMSQYENNYGTVTINNGSYGDPIYRVSSTQAQSLVNPSCASSTNYTTAIDAPVPADAEPSTGTDHSIIIYQPSTGKDWEFWEFQNNNGDFSACTGGEIANVSASNGVFPLSSSQLASSGISYLATDITETDVLSGAINHAIALQIINCNGFTAPARSNYDCSGGIIPYGQYFYFPKNVSMPSGLTPLGQMIFHAIQTYGMVVTDHSGAVAVVAETAAGWQASGYSGDPITQAMDGQPSYNIITDLPWNQLVAIQEP